VIYVSWDNAQKFVQWLSDKTGQPYRLPTESEWEYAARAGTTTPFWTGATISTEEANYDGNLSYGSGAKGVYREATVAVDDPLFPANPFGLHHVHGNVREWVQDCYSTSYAGAPSVGALAVEIERRRQLWGLLAAERPERVLRGGSWVDYPRNLRSAVRVRGAPVVRYDDLGFRVARMLTP
jgi:formylglycine-generating enzyme required for sulfatase activity